MPFDEGGTQSIETATVVAARSRRRRDAPAHSLAEGASGARAQAQAIVAYATALAGGIATAAAWLVPETALSAVLGWVGALFFVYSVRLRPAYFPAYCGGAVGHAIAFYWVFPTVATFGRFGMLISGLVFALYVALGALLFAVFVFFYRNLHTFVDRFALRAPIAIALAELVTIRLFPWHFGHTQIAFRPFVQLAGLGGAILVSFVLFWVAEAVVRAILFRERRRGLLLPLVALGLSLGYGAEVMDTLAHRRDREQEVIVVQGNGSLAEMKELDSITGVLKRTYDLTVKAAKPGALIVWPEGSIPAFLPANLGSARKDPSLPWLGDGSAFLIGAYSFSDEQHRFNSAFAVYPDGSVPVPYFKQILIPFGEYIPGASIFPWLNRMNANAGIFTPGTEVKVFGYPMRRADGHEYTVPAAPLICYEDTVPWLARRATQKGARLLVNLTFDTWFGQTMAPFQHHLIAAFRAIENRRYLIRSSNSGYSAIVDPLGKTIASIRPFTAGSLSAKVRLIDEQTPYTAYLGETPWWLLLVATTGMMVAKRWGRGSGTLGGIWSRHANHSPEYFTG
jgi:apolipoprotein N-acyltransferase